MSKQRAKGTLAESHLVRWLRENGIDADRHPLRGNLDQGDISGVGNWAVEVKNHRSSSYQAWLREAEAERVNAGAENAVVIHKPHGVGVSDPGKWIAVMTVDQWFRLIQEVKQ